MDIRLREVSMIRGGHSALERVSVQLPQGTRALVAGVTQSGKTSFLKVVAGLWRPSQGELRWGDEDPWALPAELRRSRQAAFGMVFQSDALFDSWTVLENTVLPLVRRGTSEEQAIRRATELLGDLGLSHALQKKSAELSGGMRKRAGLARALIAAPDVILADDPVAGLDPATSEQVCKLIDRVAQGRTLLVSTPEPLPFLPCPRWLVFQRGQLAYDGTADLEVLERVAEEDAA